MSIAINSKKCVGCGRCVEACPGNLITMDGQGRAVQRHPRDCWGCTACLKACPAGAVDFFLGADIGGRGATLRLKRDKGLIHWQVARPDGTTRTVTIDPKDANRY